MVDSNQKRKKILYIIILILTLIVFIIGATLAYYSIVASQKEEGTKLYTGKLEISYTDGVYIENPILWPISEPTFNTTKNVYRNKFIISSSGTLDQTLTISLKINENEFQADSLKYAIYSESGQKISSGYIPKSGIIQMANNIYLSYNGKTSYTMLMWLNENGKNQNYEQGKKFKGTITVLSEQLKY